MRGRVRRRSALTEPATEEGPFVSFTDLTIGILFLFLILVAALMMMHQEAMQRAKAEQQRLLEQIAQLQAQLDAIMKRDADHTPFRLAIVYNSFQRPADSDGEWRFTRTVQVFRAPDGNCLENVTLRNNLNLAWKPPVDPQDVPTAANQGLVRTGTPCTLSASGERWNSETETGGVDRAGPNLYRGSTVLHKADGDKTINIEYRILGIYDDYYRSAGGRPGPPPPASRPPAPSSPRPPTGTFPLQ
jgi:hypothetical protein